MAYGLRAAISLGLVALAACSASFDMALMTRNSGTTFHGTLYGRGNGTGTADVTIDGVTYSGSAVRISTSEASAFMTTIAPGHAPTSTILVTDSGGGVGVRALLSGSNGKGLRCEFVGHTNGGAGVCVDDAHEVYDVILTRR